MEKFFRSIVILGVSMIGGFFVQALFTVGR